MADEESLREFMKRCNSGLPIPPVAPADVKACWEFWQRQEEADRQVPGKTPMKAVGVELLAPYLSPGANVFAVGLRCGFLQMITKFGVLGPWMREGALDDAVFRAAAEYPFKNGDLDPADFVAQVFMARFRPRLAIQTSNNAHTVNSLRGLPIPLAFWDNR